MGDNSKRGASALLGPTPGAKVNGPRTVNEGRIVCRGIATYDKAAGIAKALEHDMGHHFSYEASGTAGNYCVIERDLDPSSSAYVD